MAHLSHLEMTNWIALYVAAGLCCGIAMILSIGTVAIQLYRERAWASVTNFRQLVLFGPRTWWRWQKLYLTSTPVTLTIVVAFGLTLTWT